MEYYNELCIPEGDQLLAGYNEVESYSVWAGGGDAGVVAAVEPEYAPRVALLVDGGHRFGVSAVLFDKYEELVWMGNQGGHVTSYYGPKMLKYTSFQVHKSDEVRQMAALEHGILILTNTCLRHQIRRGLPSHTLRSEDMQDMQCLLQVGPHSVLLGGHQEKLLHVDLNTWQHTVVAEDTAGCAVLRCGGGTLAACGSAGGEVVLRDVRTGRAAHRLRAHTACLSDVDVQGDLLVTAGFSGTAGAAIAETAVRVWDVRRLGESPAWDIPLPAAPLLLHFAPAVSGRAAAVAADGRVVLFHVNAPDEDHQYSLFQVDTQSSPVTVFDISSTSQALAFGDAAGHLHLYSPLHNTEPVFNNFSRETEFATPQQHIPSALITDSNFKVSSIPLPPLQTGARYFNYWPPQFTMQAYRKPKPIDPKVLSSMKMQGPIGYAPNPRTTRRNQMPYADLEPDRSANNTDPRSPLHFIPKQYHKVEQRYSKGGAERPGEHDKCGLPGLEATLPNSYCNPMLQVLYYTNVVKATLLAHSCLKEFCLSCELGFLFRMLDTSSGSPCQASNFLRAFRTVPEAAALGLILSDSCVQPSSERGALIQSWIRFVLHQMHLEILRTQRGREAAALAPSAPTVPPARSAPSDLEPELAEEALDSLHMNGVSEGMGEVGEEDEEVEERGESEISQLFGIAHALLNRCLKCNKQEESRSMTLACALQYPASPAASGGGGVASLLRSSLAWRRTTPAWCGACERFSPTAQRATLLALPPLLAVNFGATRPHEMRYWDKAHSPNAEGGVTVRVSGSTAAGSAGKPCRYGVHCVRPGCRFQHPDRQEAETEDTANGSSGGARCVLPLDLHIAIEQDGEAAVSDGPLPGQDARHYGLAAAVVSVSGSHNLVAYIRIRGEWYLFNDVSIEPVSASEVVEFDAWWKTPCVLLYTSLHGDEGVDAGAGPGEDDTSAAEVFADIPAAPHHTFTPLGPYEMPAPGMLVGIDAEFVTLNSERVEVRSDGQHSTLRPAHMSVARITCVRGEGPLEGVPFIDDFISTQEQVVDYMTKFSGIKPGDLDANFSSKHLTTLKSTYRKLCSLVDSGVVFVGHGLNNDFRVINLVVPPEQVVDTLQLFHLPHHRCVSLKFLAWHFLGAHIQEETHDSAEDARTALRLRRKWAELGAAGELGAALRELYRAGESCGWRVAGRQ